MSKMQLGVIYGSRSCEHDVSIISAVQLMHAADKQLYDVIPLYISKKGEWFTGEPLLDIHTYAPFDENRQGLRRVYLDATPGSGAVLTYEHGKGLFGKEQRVTVARLDCVIPVLHGMHGEDGSIQGLLELCNIPYASSSIGASAIGMDKIYMKDFFRGCGFPVLPSTWCLRAEWERNKEAVIKRIEEQLGYPVYVKPALLGSSIGVSRAENREGLYEALALAFDYDRKALVEKGLDKPIELNCSVLGYNGSANASEIEMPITGGEILSFVDKYMGENSSKGMASLKRILPAPIEAELYAHIQKLSVDVFNALDCKGVVRIDYMYDSNSGGLYITEINTIPGSLSFYLWEPCGVTYGELINRLVKYALEAQKDKDNNIYAYTSDILNGVTLGGKTGSKNGSKIM